MLARLAYNKMKASNDMWYSKKHTCEAGLWQGESDPVVLVGVRNMELASTAATEEMDCAGSDLGQTKLETFMQSSGLAAKYGM